MHWEVGLVAKLSLLTLINRWVGREDAYWISGSGSFLHASDAAGCARPLLARTTTIQCKKDHSNTQKNSGTPVKIPAKSITMRKFD